MADPAPTRIVSSDEATALLDDLRERFGPLVLHQCGEGMDAASPLCYAEDEFFLGPSDVCLGVVAGVPFYLSEAQFAFWQHRQLTLGVAPGRADNFSLEAKEGVHFFVDSRIFTDDERIALRPARLGCPDAGPGSHPD